MIKKILIIQLLFNVIFSNNLSDISGSTNKNSTNKIEEETQRIKINLNLATQDQLLMIGLNEKQIFALLEYRNQVSAIENIFELINIKYFSIKDIHALKKLISLEPNQKTTFEKDIQRASYKMGKWISNQGGTEGLSEVWLDRFFEPQNINNMNYDDLMTLPNLSPVDVTAVLKQKKRGYINGSWELKNSPGISYWGYKNLVDFVRFEDPTVTKTHIRFNSLFRTVPITSNPNDEGNISVFNNTSLPEQFHKISITSGQNLKFGLAYHRYMGQPDSIYTLKGFAQIDKINLFKNITIQRLILGNFTASFGQGVIFETTDDFSPRRTGFGFSKRAEGVNGDITRSSQYVMRGAAIQISYNNLLRGAFFSSYHPRDAIINADNSFSSLIVMQPRLPYGANGDKNKIFHSLVSSLNEFTWGANIRFTPNVGTNIGFTFFESLYDRKHQPQITNTITGGDDPDYSGDDHYLVYITNSADAEIAAMDFSDAKSPIWNKAKSYFRARSFDFSTVLSNLAIQGEYGEMLKDDNIFSFGNNPSALVLSAYAQFENLNILTLYRNYDLGFDNPYQRSFSNYQRYKTSIFEDDYWLEDPIYSFLYSGNPQPQAEEGFFISSRYHFHRLIVGYLNWDTWNRKSDNTKYYRTVATLEWRPAFNFRIKLRQKWQARGAFDVQHPSPFFSRETRITSRLRMSKYNQFEILYSRGYTTFSPRPRLTDNFLGGDMMVGNIGTPDETIGVSIINNPDNTFSIKGGILFIKGFLWYFEDTDFRVFNSEHGSTHSWISFDLKPSALLRIMFKISYSTEGSSTRIVDGQTPYGNWIKNPQTTSEDIDYRLQLSYAL